MAQTDGRYQVARSTGRCSATDRVLEPGTPCIATLCDEAEGDGLMRVDFSIEAWDDGQRPDGLFSFWRTVIPDAKPDTRVLVDDDVLLDLFDRMAEDERSQRIAFRFVLGLVLLRKRRLTFDSREEVDGDVIWHMRARGSGATGGPWRVIDPGLDDDDVIALHEQLGEILHGDL
ncbi:MAG: hypothetical protein MK077_04500 [Phycisphaerales bacterium]|nr:hypothetical protein [Phycisphaerales bacterium]